MHVIVAQREGEAPAVISAHTDDLDSLGDLCGRMAGEGVRIILHNLTELGVLEPVRAWWTPNGSQASIPDGHVIEGEVEDGGHVQDNADVQTASVSDEDESDEDDRPIVNSHCFGCKEKRDFRATITTRSNGARQATGQCEVCGKGMSKFLPKADADDEAEAEATKRVQVSAAKRDDYSTPVEPDTDDDREPTDDEMTEEIKSAIIDAAEGEQAQDVAEAAQQVAIEFSNAAAEVETIELTDEQKAATKPQPRKRASRSKSKEQQQAEEAKRIAGLPVAECFQCHEKQPVMERAGIRVMMEHSSEGNPRCKGSSTVVN